MKVFTVSQVGEMLKMSSRTIDKFLNDGRLKSYRTSDSKDRLIPQQWLVAFIIRYGMEIPAELQVTGIVIEINPRALEVGSREAVADALLELSKSMRGGVWEDAPRGVFKDGLCVGQVYYNEPLRDRTTLNARNRKDI